MMKILLTGANGFVGQTLVHRIQSLSGFELLATSASACRVKGLEPGRFSRMDITSTGQVNAVFDGFKPDVVIHCAALTQVDPCELNPDLCDKVNIEGTLEELDYSPRNLDEGLAVVRNLLVDFSV